MDELEYIVTGALTHCNRGAGVMPIAVTSNTTTHVQKLLVATDSDKTYMVNIPNYGMCATIQKPCHPIPTMWTETYDKVKVNGSHPLIGKSCLHCAVDPTSEIKFITSGQLPLEWCLSKEALEAISEANKAANEASDEYDLEIKSVGEAGFWEGFIPVWGSGRDYVHSIQTKHYWRAAANLGLVVLDVCTLGADELIIGALKGGGKGLAEAGSKVALKKIAGIIAAKKAALLLVEKFATTVSEFSIKEAGLCIAKACFVAGTPVQTVDGPKNIEDLVTGDEVWSYNEETGETGLKSILNVFEQQADTIVELTIDGEIINTTPEHPFYANSEWTEAGLLKQGDTIQLFNGKAAVVQQVVYKFDKILQPEIVNSEAYQRSYELVTVFNIEVEGWNTYFIGEKSFLVHNVVCVKELIESAAKGVAETWDDLLKFVHCFVAGTAVKTPLGDIPIELLEKGDEVFAYNFESREVVVRKVPAVYKNSTERILEIGIENEIIRCTSKHRIWVESEWIEASNLKVGMKVLGLNNTQYGISSIFIVEESTDTFNFEVEEVHNYFVGEIGILVHNGPGPKFPNSVYNDPTLRNTEIYRYYDPVTKETYYVGKTVQGLEKRASQHAVEKGLQKLVDEDKLAYEVIQRGRWSAFQTAAREQHFIMALESKLQKGMPIWNKINALSKAKFEYFKNLIKCP
ncbi:polymorphic toxin-type HINT domain-containing protein [Pedobacter psychrotolerans]|uniref:polymorphic toxin-type HINT domain-containing protein n=1 Tax=Pedobacter psychrotolerans TaxID=1843235 RepID=UPI003F9AFCAF